MCVCKHAHTHVIKSFINTTRRWMSRWNVLGTQHLLPVTQKLLRPVSPSRGLLEGGILQGKSTWIFLSNESPSMSHKVKMTHINQLVSFPWVYYELWKLKAMSDLIFLQSKWFLLAWHHENTLWHMAHKTAGRYGCGSSLYSTPSSHDWIISRHSRNNFLKLIMLSGQKVNCLFWAVPKSSYYLSLWFRQRLEKKSKTFLYISLILLLNSIKWSNIISVY